MWPFKSKVKNIRESGVLSGMTDWHSHILPGVDDGVKTMEESLQVLRELENLGVKKVWLTPHIMEDYPNETSFLKSRFEELKDTWNGGVVLCLAAENMLDSLFEERLKRDDFLPIGEEGRHLLVETSYYTPPMGMEDMLSRITSAGYFPVLAHPERYRYMDKDDYKRLRDAGVLFQLNYMSLVGGYGETAQKKAEWLLKNGMINVAGSDVHRLDTLRRAVDESPSSMGLYVMLEKVSDALL
ncbi:MAG: capsular biosynthesis protein [Muribaculaceae bacterium]|nr:capsular biosynthesis protein [Muribaculaceae bacterium]MDE6400666.1 capsular biosynthesis protein [Muribaculaceae bacterium]MDE6533847.1 capsular biosynthesis protein [Muribaculaceae bacterium]MDE6772976.1 capsular biosynthesis protein [Muribaculaceae bacterium]